MAVLSVLFLLKVIYLLPTATSKQAIAAIFFANGSKYLLSSTTLTDIGLGCQCQWSHYMPTSISDSDFRPVTVALFFLIFCLITCSSIPVMHKPTGSFRHLNFGRRVGDSCFGQLQWPYTFFLIFCLVFIYPRHIYTNPPSFCLNFGWQVGDLILS